MPRKYLIVAAILLCGCTQSPPSKGSTDVSPQDAARDDGQGSADGATQPGRDAANGGGDADRATDAGTPPRDGATPPDDIPVQPSTAYHEPASIRGGACADPNAATDACGGTSAEFVYCSLDDPTEVVMAICSTGGRSQCEVIDQCGTGWSACNATDYVERGGRDIEPSFSPTNRAWLAACVQDANGNGLRNEPCAPCTDYEPPYDPAVMWYCEDGAVVYEGGMAGDKLGVVASANCFRVGENSPANGAYWALDFASGGTSFVVCCKDGF